jgi:putative PIN family toxin of toxin-antitoxin system
VTRIVLGTNVYISAIAFGRVPREALIVVSAGFFELFTSPPLISELFRVLRDRFSYSIDALDRIESRVRVISCLVEPPVRVTKCTDPDDNRVQECAVAARAGYVVTGDNDLLRMDPFEGIRILRPAEFVKLRPWIAR